MGDLEMIREAIFLNRLCFFFFFTFFATGIVSPSHPLSNGGTLISANGTFALGFFTAPDSANRYLGIWYHNIPVQTVVWVANRRNPIGDLNATLSIAADDASLYLMTSGNSNPIWSSASFPKFFPNPISQLLDTGNFVMKSSNSSSILWQSFDQPKDTMVPGMKAGRNLKTGVDPIGAPQLAICDASGSWIWHGGPWNGFGFSGTCQPEEIYY